MALALCVGGCATKGVVVPTEFCGVPVKGESLKPFLPNDGSLKNWSAAFQATAGMSCSISVDKKHVLSANVQYFKDRVPEPVDLTVLRVNVKNAGKITATFPGETYVGTNGALVYASCDVPNSYLSVSVDATGSPVEHAPDNLRKIQVFVEDLVPREARKYGCTK
ncbi:hypothetical protein ABR738_22665 [Streptomyces sp. Edi4]|uniref:hypothetical protein n=1 Tax=Streptomyces sp. Edi4 TaxID=3162527 RepID=UPI003305F9EF